MEEQIGGSVPARVVNIIEEREVVDGEMEWWYQKLEITTNGEKIVVENGDQPMAQTIRYKSGDRVWLSMSQGVDGNRFYSVTDYVRNDGLVLLGIVFVLITVATTKLKGVGSIAGMLFTFGVLFGWILPKIVAGWDPVLVSLLAAGVIVPVSFGLSHGINRKTIVAIMGSILGLVIVAILAQIFIGLVHLSGLASEEAGMLAVYQNGSLNMKGILLAGIVIGALGVLDDITISQASIVEELRESGVSKAGELYKKAMNVGRDHITSMVNTLVLAYAGASLPLLLIFIGNPHPLVEIINYEIMAEEIVRTLVGSIGLVLAVPITTALAAGWHKTK